MQEEQFQPNEIELIDLIKAVQKRGRWILGGTLLCTLVIIGVSFLLPRVYEISAIIEPGRRPISDVNGQIVEEKVVESPEAIKETVLGGAYDEALRKKFNLSYKDYPKFKASVPTGTELVKVAALSDQPQVALKVVENLVERITEDLREKLEIEKRQISNEINLAKIEHQSNEEKLKLVSNQITEIAGIIRNLESDKKKALMGRTDNAMAVLLYSNEIQNNQIYLNDLQERYRDVEASAKIAELKIENFKQKLDSIKATKLHKMPTVSERPVKPNKALIIGLGFTLALAGSTIVTLFLEYVEKSGGARQAEEV